jgi:hypothetical protein
MRYRIVLVPVLCLALLTLVAFARASQPDETRQPGIYDDADFDDVIVPIISLSDVTLASSPGSLHQAPVVRGIALAAGHGKLPTLLLLPDASRSPPSS